MRLYAVHYQSLESTRRDRPGTKFIEAVSGGWPRIRSNPKSLLETGEVVLTHT